MDDKKQENTEATDKKATKEDKQTVEKTETVKSSCLDI